MLYFGLSHSACQDWLIRTEAAHSSPYRAPSFDGLLNQSRTREACQDHSLSTLHFLLCLTSPCGRKQPYSFPHRTLLKCPVEEGEASHRDEMSKCVHVSLILFELMWVYFMERCVTYSLCLSFSVVPNKDFSGISQSDNESDFIHVPSPHTCFLLCFLFIRFFYTCLCNRTCN